jgi:hypothetical protein
VTWVDSSKIKRNIMKYSDKVMRVKAKLTISLMISIFYRIVIPEDGLNKVWKVCYMTS